LLHRPEQAQLAERGQEIARIASKVQRLQGERASLARTLGDVHARLRRLKRDDAAGMDAVDELERAIGEALVTNAAVAMETKALPGDEEHAHHRDDAQAALARERAAAQVCPTLHVVELS
jgi:hypothetical protein